MSSRWISTSFKGPRSLLRAKAALTAACEAFTSDDLPIPRAPQSSALLAGRPRANRSVFSTSMSRTRSTPFKSDISTRLTCGTGASRPSGCQIKASAASRSGAALDGGASRSSATAIRSRTSGARGARGRAADFFLVFGLAMGRVLGFRMVRLLLAGQGSPGKRAAPEKPRKDGFSGVPRRCNWGGGGYSPREFTVPARGFRSPWLEAAGDARGPLDVQHVCVCARDFRRRSRRRGWHANVAAAVRAYFRHHVLPDPAPAAEAGEAAPGAHQGGAARRYRHHQWRPDRQGDQGHRRRPN